MGLSEILGMPGMDEETNKRLATDQLIALGASLLQNSAPSTDPRAKSLPYLVGSGLGNMLQAKTGTLNNVMGAQKIGAARSAMTADKELNDWLKKRLQEADDKAKAFSNPVPQVAAIPAVPAGGVDYFPGYNFGR